MTTTTTRLRSQRARRMITLILLGFILSLASFSKAQLTSNELTVANAGLLPLVQANNVPPGAAYLSWQRPWQIILPGNVFQSIGINLDVYDLGNSRYLLDDRLIDYDALNDALTQSPSSGFTSRNESDSDSGGGMESLLSYTTNDFYLEMVGLVGITNPAGPTAYLTVHHPDPNQIFDIFFTPGLPVTNSWYWIARGLVAQTNFTILNLPINSGYFVAGTTNGMDTNSLTAAYRHFVGGVGTVTNDFDADGLPDVWEINYFGDLSESGTNDFDNNLQSNEDAFANAVDPNTISFSLHFPAYHVNSSTPTGTIQIEGGLPLQMAVLVNNTNLASATWQPYAQNFNVSLGASNAAYDIWVGLRGRAANAQQTWQYGQLILESQAPQITITEPIASLTSQPIIQLHGYCTRPLASLFYDLSSSAGVTHGQGYVTDQYLDRSTFQFTTNWFECTDVALTGSTNVITLRATDLAGNSSTNVYTYYLDFTQDTNPPVVTVLSPKNGESVAGSTFTLRGRIDDPTATVTAQIVNASGSTNTLFGIVERNGLFWVENLPFAAGTNIVYLTMADAAGNLSSTNLTVVKSDVAITINPASESDLKTAWAFVSGTINSSNHSVWVNGIKASTPTPTGGGSFYWSAANVPLNNGGTAIIQARAIPNSDNGGNGSGQDAATDGGPPPNPNSANALTAESDPERPAFIAVKKYHMEYNWTVEYHLTTYDGGIWKDSVLHENDIADWVNALDATNGEAGGTATYHFDGWQTDWSTNTVTYWGLDDLASPPDSWPPRLPACGTFTYNNNGSSQTNDECYGPILYPNASAAEKSHWEWRTDDGSHGFWDWDTRERVTLVLQTGGKGLSTQQKLLRISAWAATYDHWLPYGAGWPIHPVSPIDLQILAENMSPIGPGSTNAYRYYLADANVTRDVTPNITAQRERFDDSGLDDYKLQIKVGTNKLRPDMVVSNAQFVVGQRMQFSYEWNQPLFAVKTQSSRWELQGNFVNVSTQKCADCSVEWSQNTDLLNSSNVTAYWTSGDQAPGIPYKATLHQTITFSNDQVKVYTASGMFSMIRPLPSFSAQIRDSVRVDVNNWYYTDSRTAHLPGTYLHFGISSSPSNDGIAFVFTNAPVNPVTGQTYGQYSLTQVIENHEQRYNLYTNGVCEGGYKTNDIVGLDGGNPAPGEASASDHSPTDWADSPGAVLSTAHWLYQADSFSTYLMFDPKTPQSIAVPMYKVSWSWFGSATNNPWGKLSGSATCDQQSAPWEQFPFWTHTIGRIDSSPQYMFRTNCFTEN